MKKLKLTSIASALILAVSTFMSPVLAGSIGLGVSVSGGAADLEGQETLKTTGLVSKKKLAQGYGAASGYIQYMFGEDGFVIGYSKTPGKVKINGDSVSTKSAQADPEAGQTTTNSASAELSGHNSIYIESPSLGGLFVKGALSTVDVITTESLGTGSTYGNKTIDGTTIGVGFRGTSESGLHMKLIGEVTNYDSINLTGVSSDGTGAENTIRADADTYAVRFSVGYNF